MFKNFGFILGFFLLLVGCQNTILKPISPVKTRIVDDTTKGPVVEPIILDPNETFLGLLFVDPYALEDQADGLTWESAFTSIGGAIKKAKNMQRLGFGNSITIALKKGQYGRITERDTLSPNGLVNLSGLSNIRIMGGFRGVKADLSDSEIELASETILYAPQSNRLIFMENTVETQATNITLERLTFKGGTALKGGAIFVAHVDNLTIVDSLFTLNKASYADGKGGALFASDCSYTSILNSTFDRNHAKGPGGALYLTQLEHLVLDSNTFTQNKSNYYGGAVFLINSENLRVTNNILQNNRALEGETLYYDRCKSSFEIGNDFSNNSAF